MPDAIECEHLLTQVSYDDELQSGRDPDEDDEQQMSFPETGIHMFEHDAFKLFKSDGK